MAGREAVACEIEGRPVRISHPDKPYFPAAGITKLQLVQYYLAVAPALLRGSAGRPIVLKRYVQGADGPAFFQKRAPAARPDWIDVAVLRFPSGRQAHEVVLHDAAQLAWVVNLGCIEIHTHPVRYDDLDHPDELRVDLDPTEGVPWAHVRRVAHAVADVLRAHGLRGWPKTSGSRGLHVYAPIRRAWSFEEVRQAAIALAREVESRQPDIATTRWWKRERHGVFIDYNQTARDRTMAAAYSVRPTPDARVSMPVGWHELDRATPRSFTLRNVPGLLERHGDAAAAMDDEPGSLASLLDLGARQVEAGARDAPLPPYHRVSARAPARRG